MREIVLIPFHIKRNWDEQVALAAAMIDDAQMALLSGSIFDQQHLLDHAVECQFNGDLVAAAAMLYALADRNSMLLEAAPKKEFLDHSEAVAKIIYEQWSHMPGYVPWVDGGNSLKQDDARRLAGKALTA